MGHIVDLVDDVTHLISLRPVNRCMGDPGCTHGAIATGHRRGMAYGRSEISYCPQGMDHRKSPAILRPFIAKKINEVYSQFNLELDFSDTRQTAIVLSHSPTKFPIWQPTASACASGGSEMLSSGHFDRLYPRCA